MCQEKEKGFNTMFCTMIDGVPTEFVFNKFANKFFLVITQFGKMGNLFTVKFDSPEEAIPGMMNVTPPLSITSSFGEDTDETRSAIQFIVNNSNLKSCPTEILCSLGLKEISGKKLREVVGVVNTFVK